MAGKAKTVPLASASNPEGVDTTMAPSLHMDHEALTQMGMHKGKMPSPGDKVPLSATMHIRSVGQSDDGRRHMSVELHDIAAGKKPMDEGAMKQGMKGAIEKAIGSESKGKG